MRWPFLGITISVRDIEGIKQEMLLVRIQAGIHSVLFDLRVTVTPIGNYRVDADTGIH